jgi:hypothetical protein
LYIVSKRAIIIEWKKRRA